MFHIRAPTVHCISLIKIPLLYSLFSIISRDLLPSPSNLRDSLAADYQRELYLLIKSKESFRGKLSPWVWHRLRSGDIVYLNLQKHNYSWTSPKNFESSTSQYVSTQDIVDIVERVNVGVEKDHEFKTKLDPFFSKFQVRFFGSRS